MTEQAKKATWDMVESNEKFQQLPNEQKRQVYRQFHERVFKAYVEPKAPPEHLDALRQQYFERANVDNYLLDEPAANDLSGLEASEPAAEPQKAENVGLMTRAADTGRAFLASGVAGLPERVFGGAKHLYDVGTRTTAKGLDLVLPESADKYIYQQEDTPEALQKINKAAAEWGPSGLLGGTSQTFGEARGFIEPPRERQGFHTDVAGGLGDVTAQIAATLVNPYASGAMMFTSGVSEQGRRQEESGTIGQSDSALVTGGAITLVTEKLGIDRLMKHIPDSVKKGGVKKFREYIQKHIPDELNEPEKYVYDALLKRVPEALKGKVARTVLDITGAGSVEATTEMLDSVAQGMLEQYTTNPDAEIFEGLPEEGVTAASVGAIARAMMLAILPGRGRASAIDEEALASRYRMDRYIDDQMAAVDADEQAGIPRLRPTDKALRQQAAELERSGELKKRYPILKGPQEHEAELTGEEAVENARLARREQFLEDEYARIQKEVDDGLITDTDALAERSNTMALYKKADELEASGELVRMYPPESYMERELKNANEEAGRMEEQRQQELLKGKFEPTDDFSGLEASGFDKTAQSRIKNYVGDYVTRLNVDPNADPEYYREIVSNAIALEKNGHLESLEGLTGLQKARLQDQLEQDVRNKHLEREDAAYEARRQEQVNEADWQEREMIRRNNAQQPPNTVLADQIEQTRIKNRQEAQARAEQEAQANRKPTGEDVLSRWDKEPVTQPEARKARPKAKARPTINQTPELKQATETLAKNLGVKVQVSDTIPPALQDKATRDPATSAIVSAYDGDTGTLHIVGRNATDVNQVGQAAIAQMVRNRGVRKTAGKKLDIPLSKLYQSIEPSQRTELEAEFSQIKNQQDRQRSTAEAYAQNLAKNDAGNPDLQPVINATRNWLEKTYPDATFNNREILDMWAGRPRVRSPAAEAPPLKKPASWTVKKTVPNPPKPKPPAPPTPPKPKTVAKKLQRKARPKVKPPEKLKVQRTKPANDSRFLINQSPPSPNSVSATTEYTRAISKLEKEFGVPVQTINATSELVTDLAPADSYIKGFYSTDTGRVFIVGDNLTDVNEAVKTYLHEVAGHKGLRAAAGKRLDLTLSGIYKMIPEPAVARLRRLYANQLEGKTKFEQQQLIADEYVAALAETNPQNTSVQKMVATVRRWLRSVFPEVAFTQNDIVDLMRVGKKRLQQGHQEAGNNRLDQREQFHKYIRDEDKTVWDKSKEALAANVRAGGNLPRKVFDAMIKKDGGINEVEMAVQMHLTGIRKAVKAVYGMPYGSLDAHTRSQLNDAMASVHPDPSIPREVRIQIYAMRRAVDGMSDRYINSLERNIDNLRAELKEGGNDTQEINKQLLQIENIKANLGAYVNRSYKAFDDPKWNKQVSAEVIDAAERVVARNLYIQSVEADIKGLRAEMKEDGANKAEIKNKIQELEGILNNTGESVSYRNRPITPAIRTEAKAVVGEILKNAIAHGDMVNMFRGGKLGSKDISVLRHRKTDQELAPEIRELLGEYTDLEMNFAKTMTKMSRLVFNNEFLINVREMGMGDFLFTEGHRPEWASFKIAAQGTEAYAPLNGLFTSKEILEAFSQQMTEKSPNGFYGMWIRINGVIKFGATVLSPATSIRNFISAGFFMAANGHNPIHAIHAIQSRRSYFASTGDRAAYLQNLRRLGVIYDSPRAGAMMDLMEDAKFNEWLSDGAVGGKVKSSLAMAQKIYQFGDDFWKIAGFEAEKNRLMKWGKIPEAKAEEMAAERIRNTYPTYSLVSKQIQKLRRFPLAGSFVAFPAEIVRTTGHMIRYTIEDAAISKRLAAQRAMGLVVGAAGVRAATIIARELAGISEEEEKAVFASSPSWQKNSNLLMWRDKDGKIRYLDTSGYDPYDYWKRSLNALMRQEDVSDKVFHAAAEYLLPFFGEDMTTNTVREMITNQKASGGEVFNKKDDNLSIIGDLSLHAAGKLAPGFARGIPGMYKAWRNEIKTTGIPYSLKDEISAYIGFRIGTVEPRVNVFYAAQGFGFDKAHITKLYTKTFKNPNEVKDQDLVDDVMKAKRVYEKDAKQVVKVIKAARLLGIDETDLEERLEQAVGKKAARLFIDEEIPPFEISFTSLGDATADAYSRYQNYDVEARFEHRLDLLKDLDLD